MDDIQNDYQNISSNINISIMVTKIVDSEYDECEDEDDYNIILERWCNKNRIKYLQEYMNIDKEALDDIDADNNVNKDFKIYRICILYLINND